MTGTIMDRALVVGDETYGELILVRHAQQGVNALGDPNRPRAGNVALSALGERQAADVGRHLADQPIDAVYSSGLYRADQTARAIATHHGLEVQVDARLREIDAFHGLPEGRTATDVLGADGLAEIERRFLAEGRWEAFPLCEPVDDFRERVAAAFDEILASHPEPERVVVVSHTVVMNQFLTRLLGMDTEMLVFPVHGSTSRLGRGLGRVALRSLNEHHYLTDPPTH